MTGTLIFLALGVILLAILLAVLLLRETPDPFLPSNGNQARESARVLTALELNLPSGELADRIFAQGDMDFILREAPLLKRMFLQERTRVATMWLKDMRICMGQIFQLYRMATRKNAALEFWTELRIARDYFTFLFMASSLQALIYLLGPFAVRGMVARTFLFEISFIAVLGTVIGVALGVLLAYQVYTIYFQELLTFAIPYAQIAGIVAAALAVTLFFTAVPALRASKIPPAEALRYIE